MTNIVVQARQSRGEDVRRTSDAYLPQCLSRGTPPRTSPRRTGRYDRTTVRGAGFGYAPLVCGAVIAADLGLKAPLTLTRPVPHGVRTWMSNVRLPK